MPGHPLRHNRPALRGRNHHAQSGFIHEWLNGKRNGIKWIGGSDAHILEEAGKIVTVFNEDIHLTDGLLRELCHETYFPRQISNC